MALTCDVVRQGMLTLGSLCSHYDSVASLSKAHPRKYLVIAEAHGKVFVKESRQILQNFQEGDNPQNPNAILACARLLCVLSLAFFRTHRENGTTLADRAAWTWLYLMRGVKTSYTALLENGALVDDIIIKDMRPGPCFDRPNARAKFICQHPAFSYVLDSRKERFDALWKTLYSDWSSLGEQETEDLNDAIHLLDEVTEQISSPLVQSLFRTICNWPVNIPTGFLNMLVDGFAQALAVYAHWLMLVILVEDLWWIGDMGRAGIRNVVTTPLCSAPNIASLLFWPQHLLEMVDGTSPSEIV